MSAVPQTSAGARPVVPQAGSGTILAQTWPMLVAQLAVVLNAAIDTAMAGRLTPDDLGGVALGISVYVALYIALMGATTAAGPLSAHHYGAGRLAEVGVEVRQALWLGAFLSVIGVPLLLWETPWRAASQASPGVAAVTADYLTAVAFGLPAAVGARVFVAVNSAVSRPKVTMAINIATLLLKAPLNALFIHGAGPIPAMGGAGCGVATAVLAWVALALSALVWRLDPYYAGMRERPADDRPGPRWPRQRALLALGVPTGLATAFEVASFSMMTVLIARQGSDALAAHQIVANMTAILFMLPLSLGFATGSLAGQALGAGDLRAARNLVLRGIRLAFGLGCAAALGLWLLREHGLRLYTQDPGVIAFALTLIGWGAAYHVFDAIQGVCAGILRNYRIAFAPMIVFGVCLWGVGIVGGYLLAFTTSPLGPPRGAVGMWQATFVGLVLAAIALLFMTLRATRRGLPRPGHA